MKILDKHYNLTGLELPRLIKLWLLGKIVPLGNLHSGPGLRCLAVLAVLHYFGRPIYYLNARYGQRLHIVKRIFRKQAQ
jgi:hypothetical protein